MAQWLKVLVALKKGLGFSPSTPIVVHIVCNSSLERLVTIPGLHGQQIYTSYTSMSVKHRDIKAENK